MKSKIFWGEPAATGDLGRGVMEDGGPGRGVSQPASSDWLICRGSRVLGIVLPGSVTVGVLSARSLEILLKGLGLDILAMLGMMLTTIGSSALIMVVSMFCGTEAMLLVRVFTTTYCLSMRG